jgi:hypothetical protein
MNSLKELSLPVLSYFCDPEYFAESSETPSSIVALSRMPLHLNANDTRQLSNMCHSSERLIRSIDPTLLGEDRAHHSKDSFFRLLCNVYFGVRRLFTSDAFIHSLIATRMGCLNALSLFTPKPALPQSNVTLRSLEVIDLPLPAAKTPPASEDRPLEPEEMLTPTTPPPRAPVKEIELPLVVAPYTQAQGVGARVTAPVPQMMGMFISA